MSTIDRKGNGISSVRKPKRGQTDFNKIIEIDEGQRTCFLHLLY
jgi:hypothetical protein